MSKRPADSPHHEDIASKKPQTTTSTKDTYLIPVTKAALAGTAKTSVHAGAHSSELVTVDRTALTEGEEVADAQGDTSAGPEDETLAAPKNMAAVTTLKKKKATKAVTAEKTATTKKAITPKKAATKKPPIADLFFPYEREVTTPPANPFWGVKPVTGDARPDPVQPSARESNGQTNPPMWEDRGYRFKRGSRHVKYFGPIAPENVDELEANLDQEDLLVTRLMDMRPTSKKDPTPRRQPTFYSCERVPKDWTDMQTIKALNDRRYQGIVRIAMDAPWSRIEREYLAALLRETPDASIWELTERHNDRFKGKDYTEATGFMFANLSTGRTVESVRHEYTTYKILYDRGATSEGVRHQNDQSQEGKAFRNSGRAVRAFGTPSKALEKAHDNETAGAEDGGEGAELGDEEGGEGDEDGEDRADEELPKSKSPKTPAITPIVKRKMLSDVIIAESKPQLEIATKSKGNRPAEREPEDDRRATKSAKIDEAAGTNGSAEQVSSTEINEKPFAGQPPLPNPDDEELLVIGVQDYSGTARRASQKGTDVDQAVAIAGEQGANVETEAADTIEKTLETVVVMVKQITNDSDTATGYSVDTVAKASSQTNADDTENATTVVERGCSIHAAREIDVDKDYGNEEEDKDL